MKRSRYDTIDRAPCAGQDRGCSFGQSISIGRQYDFAVSAPKEHAVRSFWMDLVQTEYQGIAVRFGRNIIAPRGESSHHAEGLSQVTDRDQRRYSARCLPATKLGYNK